MMKLRRVHLIAGLLATLAFVLTGQWMHRGVPFLKSFPADVHLMYVSRHIYLAGAAMVNVCPAISGLGETEMDWMAGLAQAVAPRLRLNASDAARGRRRLGVRRKEWFRCVVCVFIFIFSDERECAGVKLRIKPPGKVPSREWN